MALRLCANENIPESAVLNLRKAGHDVLWIRETSPGISDESVLALAQSEKRLLLTFDKDFGDLVFRKGAAASAGIILLRISRSSAAVVGERISTILTSRTDWEGQYSVVDDTSIRMRFLSVM